jgi:hypothetical protein
MSAYLSRHGQAAWRVSSACEQGACVMVSQEGDYVLVGNTSEPDGPTNKYTRAEWRDFLTGAKLGEFDDFA